MERPLSVHGKIIPNT
ncbi:unnamed protein product, partial [Didymodactylos carnosus]